MKKQISPKRVVGFLFDLWHVSPVLSWAMILSQVVYATLTTAVAPIFVSQLLAQIANGEATIDSSVGLLIGYAAVLIIGDVIISRTTIAMAYIVETKMQASVAKKIFARLSSKSLSYHSNRMSGGIVSDANKLTGSVERFWDTMIFLVIPIVTTVISVCIALSFILWQYAVALAVLSCIVIYIMIKSQTSIAPISRDVAEKSSTMTAHFADIIGNITAVKAFAKEKIELKQYQKHINAWRDTLQSEMKGVLLITSSFGLLMTVMNLSAFTAAILATQYHLANIAAIYLVVSYTINVVDELWTVSNATRSYLRIVGDASPMIATLDESIELKDPIKPQLFNIKRGKIEFRNVCFMHDDDKQNLFNDFTLTVKPGEQIGIVGKSGSGKTSLTRLLLRFNDVDKGQILIDGQDITSIRQRDLRSAIAYVPQEPMLFHRTLRENIGYSDANASEEKIREVSKQANALEFIEKLPRGFDTVVGERGIKLSGGQRQRIAIARAILKDAPILVLDEATSALDSENERLIQEAITKLMKGRTSIVIAHRLSTISKLDRIIVLDSGKVVEQGSHSELIKLDGVYAQLWSHQTGNFIK
ncbi:MAG: ABC transporter ATP-binding protein [Candidatus Saccharimonadales bacterium]